VLLAPLGRSNLPPEEALDLGELVRALGARGKQAEQQPDVDAIIDRLAALAESGDTIALLSNGAFGGIYPRLLQRLG
jgi:UDP-N-acetylmuramate: L-alanyl-gamma-D-glutamyl-meso-diaminopimelate ligase